VPEGGIWMNTQRPEWNDANNALVGKGLSVVTLCYLRQYLAFCQDLLSNCSFSTVPLNSEVKEFYSGVYGTLRRFQNSLQGGFNDAQRREFMDELGEAGSCYRWQFYQNGLSGKMAQTPVPELIAFLDLVRAYVEHSLRANKRRDNLVHAYNILHLHPNSASISPLYEMLEGQVTALSSGMLSADESLALLHALRNSALYRADQHSYILYPDRDLPGFLQKNCLTQEQVAGISLFARLVEAQDKSIITRDANGTYHFSGHIRNFRDVKHALDALKTNPGYAQLIEGEYEKIEELFEAAFRHNEFTGRSGTFFAYEGLGSIYWHMVAKLLLAAQETALRFRNESHFEALRQCYRDIRQGLSFNKTPDVYGAFPTDPYSHTPRGQGAKQPGMTGSVKEVILSRQAEVGVCVEDGQLRFETALLDQDEFLRTGAVFSYIDVEGRGREIDLKAGSLAYTICQTPVVLHLSDRTCVTVHYADGTVRRLDEPVLDAETSGHIFCRDGVVHQVTVSAPFDS
jgi:hypothetical protein